ncbi:MAG: hypothetical protein NC307_09785 [Roseburia sp.]|nr:hypothetical protein [Roseburia sp.]
MAKNKKVVRYRRPFHLNIGFITFGIIFIYMTFYVYSYMTSTHTSVYEVVQGTIAINNSYTGLALRTEEVFPTDRAGSINYYVKDASKVGAGDLVYSVDADGYIAKQINQASQDASTLSGEDLTAIQNKISSYGKSYSWKTFYEIYTFKSDLNSQISEALSMNALDSISDAVTLAESNATFHKGTSARDGIVVYYTDGYEGITTENFAADMFDESKYVKVNLKDRPSVESGEAAYKIITNENWDLVIPITNDTKRLLRDSTTVRVKFKKDGSTLRIPFETVEKEGIIYMILSLHNSMIRFATDRFVELELLFDEETGLKIPNSSIAAKDFFTLPMEYFQRGDNSNREGVMVRRTDKNGEVTEQFVVPEIYFATEYEYYVDGEDISDGDVILKPNSSDTYTVHETAKLNGIYSINKGYAVFKQIDIIYQNNEYAIIRSDTDYGISLYDHIALDGSTVTENALINE